MTTQDQILTDVRAALESSGLSLRDFAARAGVNHSRLHQHLVGNRTRLTLEMAQALAVACGGRLEYHGNTSGHTGRQSTLIRVKTPATKR